MRLLIGALTSCALLFFITISFEGRVANAQLKPGTFSTLKRAFTGLRDLIQSKKYQPLLKNINLNELKTSFGYINRTKPHRDLSEVPNVPNPSLNTVLTEEEIEDLDSTVFLVQFINFIFTGRYDGQTEIGNDLDENNLDAILGLGILLYQTVVSLDEYPPENAAGWEIFFNPQY